MEDTALNVEITPMDLDASSANHIFTEMKETFAPLANVMLSVGCDDVLLLMLYKLTFGGYFLL